MLATALMVSSVQFVVHSHPDHRWILVVTVGFTHSVDMDSMDDKEIIKVSVLDEIRRFQDEINKVQAENVKFYQWKLRRSSKTRLGRFSKPPSIQLFTGFLHAFIEFLDKKCFREALPRAGDNHLHLHLQMIKYQIYIIN